MHANRPARSAALVLKRTLSRVAVVCFRNGVRTLLAAIVLAGIAAVGASRLKLDPDLSELLPPWYDSVENLEALRKRFEERRAQGGEGRGRRLRGERPEGERPEGPRGRRPGPPAE